MANFQKTLDALKHPVNTILNGCSPDPKKAGNTLLYINAAGMAFAALSNTFAAAVDKNTNPEDKKFLVPAGLVTGVANIGVYFALTNKVIEKLKAGADEVFKNMPADKLKANAKALVDKRIEKNDKSLWLKLTKGEDEVKKISDNMKALWKDGDNITDKAIEFYKDNTKAAVGVAGAFFGAVVGCAIITPVIRDISAYFVQKYMEKKNPQMKEEPYKPYFEPTRIESRRYGNKKQPLSMKNYMAFTNGGNLKI